MALAKNSNAKPHGVNEDLIKSLFEEELHRYTEANPASAALNAKARETMLHGVPLHWMSQWPGPFPIAMDRAHGARLTDIDGHTYVDFCMGDSGAFFGHGNDVVSKAIADFITTRGATTMLPSEDAIFVSQELKKRFNLPYWQFTVSATDANRFAIRAARAMTGRDLILVFNGKYHGSVDDTQVELEDGEMTPQHGIHPNAVRFDETTRVIEYNDVDALRQALADEKVACVLAEPLLTNIGMVPPIDGYNDALRELTRETGTLLIIDETHTVCAGPGGCTQRWGLEPDIMVMGKVLACGIPSAVWGLSEEVGKALEEMTSGGGINHYGFGGTLSGNALTLHAMRTTLEEVMTPDTYAHMETLAQTMEQGIARAIEAAGLPWHVSRIGARVEYLYSRNVPKNGGEAAAARDDEIEECLHLFFLNRGILLSPFHNMVLISPYSSMEDVQTYLDVFGDVTQRFAARD